jgi:hypothetical protein
MAYGLSNSDFDFPYDPRKQELEVEKQVLQRRIREINFELDDLRDSPTQLDDRDWMDQPCPPVECSKFESFMQSAIVVGLSIGALVLILI